MSCGRCRYHRRQVEGSPMGEFVCKRFPNHVRVSPAEWCGEFKEQEDPFYHPSPRVRSYLVKVVDE